MKFAKPNHLATLIGQRLPYLRFAQTLQLFNLGAPILHLRVPYRTFFRLELATRLTPKQRQWRAWLTTR